MSINCSGCGAQLQNIEEEKIGYTPAKEIKKNIICLRCFKLKHYSEVIDYDVDPKKYEKILKQIEIKSSLLVIILDINDLISAQNTINYFKNHYNKLYVFNKIDILPKSKKKNFYLNYVNEMLDNIDGELFIMSAMKTNDTNQLRNILNDSEFKHIYFVGAANVGKSTIVNQIIQNEDIKNKPIVSHLPGTTYNIINLRTKTKLFTDTPGLINTSSTLYNIQPSLIKKVLPKKEIKPRHFQLNEQQTMFIDNYAIFKYNEGIKIGFAMYFSNELNLHRTSSENFDRYFENHFKDLNKESYKQDFELVTHKFYLEKESDKYDLVIDGLGWISFYIDSDVEIEIMVPDFVKVEKRLAIV